MAEPDPNRPTAAQTAFSLEVGAQEKRKINARRLGTRGIWSGFGTFGLIGGSVTVPTLLGAMLGAWLDERRAGVHVWTLPLLIVGLCIGCANAWYWVAQSIEKQDKKHDEEKDA